MKKDDIVYSINVEDLQAVAKVVYGIELSDEQLERVCRKVGNHFSDWFERVEFAIDNTLDLDKLKEPNWDEYPY